MYCLYLFCFFVSSFGRFSILFSLVFYSFVVSLSISVFLVTLAEFLIFQAFGIGYKTLHPDGVVRVHSDEPRPILRVKPDEASRFRRYNFVNAVLALDPAGKLGLTSSDYQV